MRFTNSVTINSPVSHGTTSASKTAPRSTESGDRAGAYRSSRSGARPSTPGGNLTMLNRKPIGRRGRAALPRFTSMAFAHRSGSPDPSTLRDPCGDTDNDLWATLRSNTDPPGPHHQARAHMLRALRWPCSDRSPASGASGQPAMGFWYQNATSARTSPCTTSTRPATGVRHGDHNTINNSATPATAINLTPGATTRASTLSRHERWVSSRGTRAQSTDDQRDDLHRRQHRHRAGIRHRPVQRPRDDCRSLGPSAMKGDDDLRRRKWHGLCDFIASPGIPMRTRS